MGASGTTGAELMSLRSLYLFKQIRKYLRLAKRTRFEDRRWCYLTAADAFVKELGRGR